MYSPEEHLAHAPFHDNVMLMALSKLLHQCRPARIKNINKIDKIVLDKINRAIIEKDYTILEAIGSYDDYGRFLPIAEKFANIFVAVAMLVRTEWLNTHDLNIDHLLNGTGGYEL